MVRGARQLMVAPLASGRGLGVTCVAVGPQARKFGAVRGARRGFMPVENNAHLRPFADLHAAIVSNPEHDSHRALAFYIPGMAPANTGPANVLQYIHNVKELRKVSRRHFLAAYTRCADALRIAPKRPQHNPSEHFFRNFSKTVDKSYTVAVSSGLTRPAQAPPTHCKHNDKRVFAHIPRLWSAAFFGSAQARRY
jgi:hypothetical protein